MTGKTAGIVLGRAESSMIEGRSDIEPAAEDGSPSSSDSTTRRLLILGASTNNQCK